MEAAEGDAMEEKEEMTEHVEDSWFREIDKNIF